MKFIYLLLAILIGTLKGEAAFFGLSETDFNRIFSVLADENAFSGMRGTSGTPTFNPTVDYREQEQFFSPAKRDLFLALSDEADGRTVTSEGQRSFYHVEMRSGIGAASQYFIEAYVTKLVTHLRTNPSIDDNASWYLYMLDNFETREAETGVRGTINIPRRKGPGVSAGDGESASSYISQYLSNVVSVVLGTLDDLGVDLLPQLDPVEDGTTNENNWGLLNNLGSKAHAHIFKEILPVTLSPATDFVAAASSTPYFDASVEIPGLIGNCMFVTVDLDSRNAEEIYLVAVNAWNYLAPGGIVVFDDYMWKHSEDDDLYAVRDGLALFFTRHVSELHAAWNTFPPTFTYHPPAAVVNYQEEVVISLEKETEGDLFAYLEGNSAQGIPLTGSSTSILRFDEINGPVLGKWVVTLRKDLDRTGTLTPVS